MNWHLILSVCFFVIGYGLNRYVLIAIQDQLIFFYSISDVDYNLLASLYSWPNAITLLLCGFTIDKIGLIKVLVISWIITMIESCLSVISALPTFKSFVLLCIGRIIVGIGNESLNISLKVFIVNSFNKNEYGFTMSAFSSSINIASAINNPLIYEIYSFFDSIQIALSVPLIISPILSLPLVLCIIYNHFTQINQKHDESTMLITPNSMTNKTKTARKQTIDFNVSALKQFKSMYWILVVIGGLFCMNFMSWANIRVSFIHHTYGYNYSLAALLSMVYNVGNVSSSLITGIIIDKFGIRCRILMLVCLSIGIAYFLFGWVHINMMFTIFNLLLCGVSVGAFLPIYYSSFPILVNENVIGTAYGIADSFRLTCMGIGFIIVGSLTKNINGNQKYINVQYFETILSLITFIFMFILFRLDAVNGYKLDKPTHKITQSHEKSNDTIANYNQLTDMELNCSIIEMSLNDTQSLK
eukprot:32180_1